MNCIRQAMLVLCCIVGIALQAQSTENFPPPEEPIIIKAIKAENLINLDGRLDETDWSRAIPVTDFFKREPRQGGSIKYKTEVRFLYNDKYLYVGAFCSDSIGTKGIRVARFTSRFFLGRK